MHILQGPRPPVRPSYGGDSSTRSERREAPSGPPVLRSETSREHGVPNFPPATPPHAKGKGVRTLPAQTILSTCPQISRRWGGSGLFTAHGSCLPGHLSGAASPRCVLRSRPGCRRPLLAAGRGHTALGPQTGESRQCTRGAERCLHQSPRQWEERRHHPQVGADRRARTLLRGDGGSAMATQGGAMSLCSSP